mmetsp:Transcript_41677/g.126391  ORF Transcript_41677/g.126391 Transcript_41677/m.126391 type:complete len:119 (-) Transcript_41677:1786-2142(-)
MCYLPIICAVGGEKTPSYAISSSPPVQREGSSLPSYAKHPPSELLCAAVQHADNEIDRTYKNKPTKQKSNLRPYLIRRRIPGEGIDLVIALSAVLVRVVVGPVHHSYPIDLLEHGGDV